MSAERVWFWVKVSAAVLASSYLAFLGFGAAREAASGKSGTVFDDLGERSLTPADYSREMGVGSALLLGCAGTGFWCTSIAVRRRRSPAR